MTKSAGSLLSNSHEHQIMELLQEQVTLFRAWMQPLVIVDVYPRRSINLMYFRIRNVGQTPAFNIRVVVDPTLTLGTNTLSSELNIFNQAIGVLGPKEEISFFFENAVSLSERPEIITQFQVTTTYRDLDDKEYTRTFEIDLNLLKGLAIELPASDKVVDQLERIRRDIEKLARYADRLRTRELQSEYDRFQERSATEHQTED
jgi:hypothetical protein